jgi:hypothetical protein
MLEKISRLAEKAAGSASRRQFLGRFSRSALVTAAALGGLLALPRKAQAARCPPHCHKVRGICICPR